MRRNSASARLLLDSLRSERPRMVAAVGLTLISAATGVIVPLQVAGMMTRLAQGRPMFWVVLELVAVVLVGAVASGGAAYLLGYVGERAVAHVRKTLVVHALRMPLHRVQAFGSGELASRTGNDAAQLRTLTDTAVTSVPVSGLLVVAYLAVMGWLDWVLLAVVVATFVLAACAMRWFIRGMRDGAIQQQIGVGELVAQTASALGVLGTVKAFGAERQIAQPLHVTIDRTADAAVRTTRAQAAVLPLMTMSQQVAIVAVLATGGWRMTGGHLTPAHFVAFLMYLFQLVNPLMTVAQGVGRWQIGTSAAHRLDEVLGAAVESEDETAPTHNESGEAVVLHDVSASVPDVDEMPVLRGVDLELPRRGLTAIVGPVGSGKSSLLAVIEGFLPTTSGKLEYFGRPSQQWSVRPLRRRILLIEQSAAVLHDTVRANLTLGAPQASDAEQWRALRQVGLDARVQKMPSRLDTAISPNDLSGGERQRLAVARALLTDAAVLLFDEPTSSLDGAGEADMNRLLEHLAHTRCVVVVSHRISTVRNADRIVVLADGTVHATGTHHQLLASDAVYRSLAAMPESLAQLPEGA